MRLPPMDRAAGKLREVLAESHWPGGMSRSGKSTTARLLADRYGPKVIARDDCIEDHWRRATPDEFPAMCKGKRIPRGQDPEWTEYAEGPLPEIVQWFLRFVEEDWILTMEDLSVSSAELTGAGRPLLIEGARLSPAGVAKLLSEPRRAAWLAPSRATVGKRMGKGWAKLMERFADPAEGHRRMTDIFHAVSEGLAQAAEGLCLGVVRVEAIDGPEAVAARVARFYGL